MKYEDLLKSHLNYGTTSNDIITRNNYEKLQKNVVIAPWWKHEIFNTQEINIEKISDKIYNFYNDKIAFSFIELREIGAPATMEAVLSLGVTDCENIVFIGSVGSINENINIGDIVIPKYSICGDGASRYLNENLEDEFLKKEYPSKTITNELISIIKSEHIKYHNVPNISIDTIFAQFYHIDKIKELGAQTIEMETANLFKCNDLLNKNVTALLCVSDNTILKKSLFSGRSEKENLYRQKIKNEIIPKLVIKSFENLKNNSSISK